MRYFDLYGELMGVPYDDGDHDCYGLCRRFYQKNYELDLPNYGRSASFFGAGIDLVKMFLDETDFKITDVAMDRLELGDALLISVPIRGWPKGAINHLGVYVGNRTYVHHPFGRESREDAVIPAMWVTVCGVLRSHTVTAGNAKLRASVTTNVLDLVPDHVKQRYGIVTPSVLEPASGAVRSDPVGGDDHRTEKRKPRAKKPTDRGSSRGRSVQG